MKKATKSIRSSGEPSAERTTLSIDVSKRSMTKGLKAQMKSLGDSSAKLLSNVELPALKPIADSELPNEASEPVYSKQELQQIQGNTVPGFNKDHQHFIFLKIKKVTKAKRWLVWVSKYISSMDEVLSFVRLHRATRMRNGTREPSLNATWLNIGFSYGGIAKLTSRAEADKFGDQSFRQGLAERSTYIGDPVEDTAPGHRSNWVVGGPKNEADILVIVASDVKDHLIERVKEVTDKAVDSGLSLVFEQRGDTLPGELRGHEHFGFKDGVSQPGVRGKVSSASGDFITPRYLKPEDPRARYFSKPGQLLLWPGQFLLGEQRQDPDHLTRAAPAASNFPVWGRLGSYVVCRRLRQDVVAFWSFAEKTAKALSISTEQLASMLVGRWPSGAPILRSPLNDNRDLAGDPWANNHFIFDDDTRRSQLREVPGYDGDNYPLARADVLGAVCPHFSHIRKTNPRDHATDLGKAQDSMIRMILRRGIPFGRPIVGISNPSAKLIKEERGLMFLSYGSTIEDQFEFIVRRWVNSAIQPNEGGIDPVLGRSDGLNGRLRYIEFPTGSGTKRIELKGEWITPTGGGYFFSPPIRAITKVLAN